MTLLKKANALLKVTAVFSLAAACEVESNGKSACGVMAEGSDTCPAGLVATMSDFLSSEVALLGLEGEVLAPSCLSSGSTQASNLAAPFSGDLVLPSSRSQGEVVIIDRFGVNVISWADPRTGKVRAQLSVATGFESNPYDYLELSPNKAYVARLADNNMPGREQFDQGSDVLIIDPSVPVVTGSIALPRDMAFPPAPVGFTRRGNVAITTLQRLDSNTFTSGESELIGLDTGTDQIAWRKAITGKKACGRGELSPSKNLLAVSCTGVIDVDGSLADPVESGLLIFDAAQAPPVLLQSISIHGKLGFSPQDGLAFAGENWVLGKTQTPWGGAGNNQLFRVNLETQEVEVMLEASPGADGKGKGIVYGGLVCLNGCNSYCFMTDADKGVIRKFDMSQGFIEEAPIKVGSPAGLPPLGLGLF